MCDKGRGTLEIDDKSEWKSSSRKETETIKEVFVHD